MARKWRSLHFENILMVFSTSTILQSSTRLSLKWRWNLENIAIFGFGNYLREDVNKNPLWSTKVYSVCSIGWAFFEKYNWRMFRPHDLSFRTLLERVLPKYFVFISKSIFPFNVINLGWQGASLSGSNRKCPMARSRFWSGRFLWMESLVLRSNRISHRRCSNAAAIDYGLDA